MQEALLPKPRRPRNLSITIKRSVSINGAKRIDPNKSAKFSLSVASDNWMSMSSSSATPSTMNIKAVDPITLTSPAPRQ